MAYKRNIYRGQYTDGNEEYICDTVADISSLPTNGAQGSTANVIADGSVYKLNSAGLWVRQPAGGGSGGGGSGGTVTVTSETEDGQTVYTVWQDGASVGEIVVPDDIYAVSGVLVENPTGQEEGTYLELSFNGQDSKVYIPVTDLIDTYTAAQNATQIQITVTDHVISASVVAGSIGTAQLSTDVNTKLNTITTHVNAVVASEAGAHGLRYYNGTLQYKNGNDWVPLSIANLSI